MFHQLSGKLTGLGDSVFLVFSNPDFRCDVHAIGGYYAVQLKPGRYAVSYLVFNNFTRFICEVEVLTSLKLDIQYQAPKMAVKVHNLPAGTQGGMVYLRHPNGSFTGRRVENLEQFDLDFQSIPDLFLKTYDQLGIEVGGTEHSFPFNAQIGGTLDLDFSKSTTTNRDAEPCA